MKPTSRASSSNLTGSNLFRATSDSIRVALSSTEGKRQVAPKDFGGSSGMALLITLVIMLILAVLVNRFTFTSRVHLAAAANLRDQLQAECLALSGVELALALLEEDDTPEVDHIGEPWAQPRQLSGEELGLLEGALAVLVQDESGKIDINRLVKEDGSTTDEFVHRQLDRLLGFFGIPSDQRDALLDCLEDWLDDDDLQKLNGAEAAYYQALETPYLPRNGPLRSLGELTLVKGWKEIMHARLEDGRALLDFLSTGPTQGTINVNTASPLVLMTLSHEIDESTAEQVVILREEAPLTGPQLLPPPSEKRKSSPTSGTAPTCSRCGPRGYIGGALPEPWPS